MIICTFGLPSPSIPTELTIEVLKWPSFKNGSLASTFPSFVNSTTQRKVFSKNPFLTPTHTKARFEQTKMLRSNDGGLLLCYALRRLANNTQEPFRTLSLTAIDASIKWWHGKPAPKASALRAPWSLSPNLQSQLKKFLRQWHLQMLDHQVPCHTPSFKTVFIKHAAVLDILCNHKQAIEDWSTSNPAICCCKSWSCYKSAALNPSDPLWVLSGSRLHSLLPPELAVIAEGSLSNKVFPSKNEHHNQMRLAFKTLDEEEWPTFHATGQHFGSMSSSLVRTHSTDYQPHYKVLHQSTSVHI